MTAARPAALLAQGASGSSPLRSRRPTSVLLFCPLRQLPCRVFYIYFCLFSLVPQVEALSTLKKHDPEGRRLCVQLEASAVSVFSPCVCICVIRIAPPGSLFAICHQPSFPPPFFLGLPRAFQSSTP